MSKGYLRTCPFLILQRIALMWCRNQPFPPSRHPVPPTTREGILNLTNQNKTFWSWEFRKTLLTAKTQKTNTLQTTGEYVFPKSVITFCRSFEKRWTRQNGSFCSSLHPVHICDKMLKTPVGFKLESRKDDDCYTKNGAPLKCSWKNCKASLSLIFFRKNGRLAGVKLMYKNANIPLQNQITECYLDSQVVAQHSNFVLQTGSFLP